METERARGNAKGTTSEVVAANVRRIRQTVNMDLAQLAEKLKQVGWYIPVAALSRLENGKRRIDVDDLMALSHAIGVPPSRLLDPNNKVPGSPPFATSAPQEVAIDEIRAWLRDDLETLDLKGRIQYWNKYSNELELDLPRVEERAKKWSRAVSKDPTDVAAENAARISNHEVERTRRNIKRSRARRDELLKEYKAMEASDTEATEGHKAGE